MSLRFDRSATKRLRRERGLTVKELARAARLSDVGVGLIERGAVDPKASTLAKLAMALGVTVDAFFIRKDTKAA